MGKAAHAKRSRPQTAEKPIPGLDPSPVIRFVVVFVVVLLAFQFAYYGLIVDSGPFHAYLVAIGRLAANLLGALGERVVTADNQMTSSFSMSVASGCDALQAMAILVIAVVAFPGAISRKLLGVIGGAGLLFALNIVRVASLFWTGVHAPGWFETLHTDVWPAAIVACAVLLWVVWARWSLTPSYAS
jgi:exosortase family protein XrtM